VRQKLAGDQSHTASSIEGSAVVPKLLLKQQDVVQEKIDEAVKNLYSKTALKINSSQPKPAKSQRDRSATTPKSTRAS